MAVKIFIKSNFLIVRNDVKNNSYIRVATNDVTPVRDEYNNFGFFSKIHLRLLGIQMLSQFGFNEGWNPDIENPPSQTVFRFDEILDEAGDPYPSADALDDYLCANLGTETIIVNGLSGYLTYVATDATLTGDGTPGFPLKVVPLIDKYEERFDPFQGIVNGAWHTIGGFPPNRIISIICEATQNSKNMGVRRTGSIINRQVELNAQSTASFSVETDMAGQIEVFTTNIASTNFYVESYLF